MTGALVAVFFAVAVLGSPGAPDRKCVIAVAPVGDVSVERIEALSSTLRETFGCEIEIAPPVPLPSSGWNACFWRMAFGILEPERKTGPPEPCWMAHQITLSSRPPASELPAPFAAQLIEDGYGIRTNLQRLPSLVEKPIKFNYMLGVPKFRQ